MDTAQYMIVCRTCGRVIVTLDATAEANSVDDFGWLFEVSAEHHFTRCSTDGFTVYEARHKFNIDQSRGKDEGQ